MKKLLVAIILLSAVFASAQSSRFKWDTELCEFEGTYDTRKYTAAQLKYTRRLLRPDFSLQTEATPWEISGVKSLDVAALDKEYAAKTAELKNLNIVKTPFWESLKQKHLEELEQVYRLKRTTMAAFQKPVVLREYKGVEACLKNFGEPLIAGGESLLTAWRKVNEESRRRNSDPNRLMRIFNEQMKSPDKMRYAQLEVMTFGWWNCANNSVARVAYDESLEKEFRKLLTRVRTISCDEP
jgi:hypothetical protein